MSKLRKRTMLAVLIAAASVVVVASTVTRHLSNEELACTVNLSVGVKDIEVGSGGIVCLPPGETYASSVSYTHLTLPTNREV